MVLVIFISAIMMRPTYTSLPSQDDIVNLKKWEKKEKKWI